MERDPTIREKNGLARRLSELRAELKGADPAEVAGNSGAQCRTASGEEAEIRLDVWGRAVRLRWPELIARSAESGRELPVFSQALILYYLRSSDGTCEAGRWVSLGALPDGIFYQRAFQGYTGDELARAFGGDLDGFSRAALSIGGKREPMGEASFSFRVLPRVSLCAVYWGADEEFPAHARVLFDASASHFLPTDVCAIVGADLTRKLIRAKSAGGAGKRN